MNRYDDEPSVIGGRDTRVTVVGLAELVLWSAECCVDTLGSAGI
jgi:hypothetical protein